MDRNLKNSQKSKFTISDSCYSDEELTNTQSEIAKWHELTFQQERYIDRKHIYKSIYSVLLGIREVKMKTTMVYFSERLKNQETAQH